MHIVEQMVGLGSSTQTQDHGTKYQPAAGHLQANVHCPRLHYFPTETAISTRSLEVAVSAGVAVFRAGVVFAAGSAGSVAEPAGAITVGAPVTVGST